MCSLVNYVIFENTDVDVDISLLATCAAFHYYRFIISLFAAVSITVVMLDTRTIDSRILTKSGL